MVMKPVYCLGLAGGPTIQISQDELRSLLGQIEAELHRSKAYCSALASLETLLGEAAQSAKILVKAVGREAIQLAFMQFAKQYRDVPAATHAPETAVSSTQPSPQAESISEPEVNTATSTTSTEVDTPAATKSGFSASPLLGFTKPTKKPTKAEIAEQIADQERSECLRCIGQQLQKERIASERSLTQLHKQTHVPIHLIEALENGREESLPEDVYVRGFIRRLGDALGLDGANIAASLPAPDPVKAVLPTWYKPDSASGANGLNLRPVHLYLGYATLVAGAVGGLALLSQQSNPGVSSQPLPEPSQSQEQTQAASPNQKSTTTDIAVIPDISPPEGL